MTVDQLAVGYYSTNVAVGYYSTSHQRLRVAARTSSDLFSFSVLAASWYLLTVAVWPRPLVSWLQYITLQYITCGVDPDCVVNNVTCDVLWCDVPLLSIITATPPLKSYSTHNRGPGGYLLSAWSTCDVLYLIFNLVTNNCSTFII